LNEIIQVGMGISINILPPIAYIFGAFLGALALYAKTP
jgi:hypothetical protein